MSELTIERASAALMEHMAECTADSEAHQLVRMLLCDHLPPLDEIAAAAYGRASGGGTLDLLLKDRLTTVLVYFAPRVTQLFSRGTRDVSIPVNPRQPPAQRGTWQGG